MLQSALVPGFLPLFCQYTFRMLQLPFVREQFQQFLMSCLFIIRHSGDDIIQIIPRVYIMCLTGGQQGADDRHIDSRLMVAAEEVIFLPRVIGRMTFSARLLSQSRRPSSRHLIMLPHRVHISADIRSISTSVG